jgi:dTDP-4-dehydrorhamnose reductase
MRCTPTWESLPRFAEGKMTEVLVTGAGGSLGSVLMRVLSEARIESVGMVSPHGPRPHFGKVVSADLCDLRTFEDLVFSLSPKVIVHLAAVTQIAAAYADPEHAHAMNVEATSQLVTLAQAVGARFVYASTDLVFDGEEAPYDEDASTDPLSCYGRTKLGGECYVLTYRRGLVVRFPLLYGVPEVSRSPSWFESTVQAFKERRRVRLFSDEFRTPLWLDDAARVCVHLVHSELAGVVHAGGPERLSRVEMGQRIATALRADSTLIDAVTRDSVDGPEPRPADTSLDSTRLLGSLGQPAGLTMHEALPLIFSRHGSPFLS